MHRGEIYLAGFPFGDAPGMKLRPVLLLTGPVGMGNEIVVAYISSILPESTLPTDVILEPLATGLKLRSVLRLHKIATIHIAVLRRYLGRVSTPTESQVKQRISEMLDLDDEQSKKTP